MYPDQFIPTFKPGADAPADALVFAYVGDEQLLHADLALPSMNDLAPMGAPAADSVVGMLDGRCCRALAWPRGTAVPPELSPSPLRDALGTLSFDLANVSVRSRQMLTWDLHSRHCGACGAATQTVEGEPAKQCTQCGLREYPRIAPAAMILIRHGRQLLLARSPHFRPGVYSALAGFIEAGECVETCIHREVFEEVGVRVKNLRYYSSQSWPFPHSLMLAFHAEYVAGDIVPQPGEIEDAQWFDIDALPLMPSQVSIAGRLIADAVDEIRAAVQGKSPQ